LKKVYVSTYDRSGKQSSWRVKNINKNGATQIVNYFDKFPLFSSKHLHYLNWKEVNSMLTNN